MYERWKYRAVCREWAELMPLECRVLDLMFERLETANMWSKLVNKQKAFDFLVPKICSNLVAIMIGFEIDVGRASLLVIHCPNLKLLKADSMDSSVLRLFANSGLKQLYANCISRGDGRIDKQDIDVILGLELVDVKRLHQLEVIEAIAVKRPSPCGIRRLILYLDFLDSFNDQLPVVVGNCPLLEEVDLMDSVDSQLDLSSLKHLQCLKRFSLKCFHEPRGMDDIFIATANRLTDLTIRSCELANFDFLAYSNCLNVLTWSDTKVSSFIAALDKLADHIELDKLSVHINEDAGSSIDEINNRLMEAKVPRVKSSFVFITDVFVRFPVLERFLAEMPRLKILCVSGIEWDSGIFAILLARSQYLEKFECGSAPGVFKREDFLSFFEARRQMIRSQLPCATLKFHSYGQLQFQQDDVLDAARISWYELAMTHL